MQCPLCYVTFCQGVFYNCNVKEEISFKFTVWLRCTSNSDVFSDPIDSGVIGVTLTHVLTEVHICWPPLIQFQTSPSYALARRDVKSAVDSTTVIRLDQRLQPTHRRRPHRFSHHGDALNCRVMKKMPAPFFLRTTSDNNVRRSFRRALNSLFAGRVVTPSARSDPSQTRHIPSCSVGRRRFGPSGEATVGEGADGQRSIHTCTHASNHSYLCGSANQRARLTESTCAAAAAVVSSPPCNPALLRLYCRRPLRGNREQTSRRVIFSTRIYTDR